jgi:hypothetical protein
MQKINRFIEKIYLDDTIKMQKFDAWQDYIIPKFEAKNFDFEYRFEYEKMYGDQKIINFLEKERKKFDKKFDFVYYLENNENDILDKNLEWNDCILDLESEYALFKTVKECKEYNYSKINVITFLN